MTIHLGNVPASSTLYIPFASYNSTGASVTLTGLATSDILIYKNGSVTQRSSTAGFTLLDTDGIDFDGVTGLHGFSVDLSDNTDASFYAVGSFYWVVVSTVTIDSQTVTFIAATFRIVAAEGVTGKPKVDVDAFGGMAGTFASGRPEVNTTHIAGSAVNTASAQLGVNVVQLSGDSTAADNAESFFDGTGYAGTNNVIPTVTSVTAVATDGISAASLAADAGTEIGTAVWATTTRLLTAGTNIALAKGTGVTGFNDLSAAQVNAEVDTAIADASLATAANLATVDTVVDGIAAAIGTPTDLGAGATLSDNNTDMAGATFDTSTDSLEAIRNRGDAAWTTGAGGSAPTAAEIADAVWDEATAGHASAGTYGLAVSDVLDDTAEIGTAGAGLTNINLPNQTIDIVGNITGNLSGSVGSVTGSIGSLAAQAKTDIANAALTTQMTESYAANGVAPTVAQALFAVQQFLMDKDISGTNYTVRKLDGSTTAFVATLNDAVAPTASTRT